MSNKIYSLTVDGKVQEECEFPKWINQPQSPDKDDPYWRPWLPAGPLPDPGSEAGGVGSGFPIGLETPILVFEKPLGSLPFPDVLLDGGRGELTLSDRAKIILESIDGDAFEFRETITRLHDGSDGPKYWLADVTCFLNAVDEERSKEIYIEEKIIPHNGRTMRRVHLGMGQTTIFKASVVAGHHVFRLPFSPQTIVVDEVAASTIRPAKLRGIFLWPTGMTHVG